MAQVLRYLPTSERDPNLLVGAETFDDGGVYRLGDGLAIVQTIDFFPPVVDDAYIYGQIAAANAISDIYAMGGQPRTVLNLVGFPDDELPLDILGTILSGGLERARRAGACVIGGHTVRDAEIKYGMAVTGVVDPERMTTNAHAQPGDVLYLTKGLGTGFVTTAHRAGRCPDATFRAACESMVALNDTAAAAMAELGVRSATDITGFGFAGHANEMAAGSEVTFVLHLESLPILPGAEALVAGGYLTRASKTNADYVADYVREEGRHDRVLKEFLYDAQTSGGLLLAVPSSAADRAEATLRSFAVPVVARVGEVVDRIDDVHLILR